MFQGRREGAVKNNLSIARLVFAKPSFLLAEVQWLLFLQLFFDRILKVLSFLHRKMIIVD